MGGSHTGIASGYDSAVAYGGGLMTTAMLGMVVTAQGRALLVPFHAALIVCAASAVAAAVCAFTWVYPKNTLAKQANSVEPDDS